MRCNVITSTLNIMKRKDFIKRVAVIAAGVPALAIVNSCSKEEQPTPSNNTNPPNTSVDCLANGTNSTISSNHGHTLTVSKEEVDAATEKTYSIQGTSAHNHEVTITTDQFASLKNNNQSITVSSTSSSGHSHSVTVSCA